ncbi:inositol monophosphatase family protein [Amycolatopsis samaneae]|uniref:Inositol monophosphatase n=1 Tax=Amycolatopsis samaneae TaxID=664691 RepID=A0ABW5GJK5_9PSEU
MTTNALKPVIELVEALSADLPAHRPATPPRDLEELDALFHAVDDPLAARLRAGLAEIRPEAGWADDEFAPGGAGGEYWVVDALDGAVQFLQGLPQWCVTVSLVRDGEPVLAVLHSPSLRETYAAERGAGAWRDGRPITPSRKTSLDAAVVATSQPPFVTRQREAAARAGRALPEMLGRVVAVRNLGPTSWQLADVASGRLDLFWQYGSDAANLLGAALVAREAGALVTTCAGTPWTSTSDSFLAAPAALHPAAVEILTEFPADMRPNVAFGALNAPNATLGASNAPNATLGRSTASSDQAV